MTSDGGRGDEFQQVNNRVNAENVINVNGVVSNGPKSRIDDKLRISQVVESVKDGCHQEVVRGNGVPQAPKQHPRGPLVYWERFLHVRSIKVMLVENDDSTRHIVTALLRNCNYEVIEAANGFQAWKILKDLSNHIDIVLTEVVMPCISGICLLCKIMSHKTRKNIPVIMMSSHDSMGLVFKCLSKGAVDFLVKPIRKNELKILWQHVWRRCHSSSGSGTGSESGTQAQKSVNSKSSLRSDDNGSNIGDDTDDGSDDVSGTQSSWTRQAVELDNSPSAALCDQITECPDSTCGLVIRSAETQATREFNDNGGKGKELATGRSKGSKMETEFPFKVPIKHNGIERHILQVYNPTQTIKTKDEGQADIITDHTSNKHKAKEHGEFEAFGEPKEILDLNIKFIDDSNGVTSGDLGLKRPRIVKVDEIEVPNGCNILRHSELSAFKWYNTTPNALKTSRGTTASSSPIDNRSKMVKKESTRDAHSEGFPPRDLHHELSIQHMYHHHHVHHYHTIDTMKPLSNHEAADAPRGSSNVLGGAVEGNLKFYSLNRSVSGSKHGSGGSKHGSNGQNGSSTVVNFGVTNAESDVALAGKSGSGSGDRIDHHQKSAQREAALTKFRQKRKERCFQKKVRYQNRKRLAEQRPRVRGQFVKQAGRGSSNNAADG